jgi:hypothetical protein
MLIHGDQSLMLGSRQAKIHPSRSWIIFMADLTPSMTPACAFVAEPPREADGAMLASLTLALGFILARLWLGG